MSDLIIIFEPLLFLIFFPGREKRTADSRLGERQSLAKRAAADLLRRRCPWPSQISRTLLQDLVLDQPRSHLLHGHVERIT